MRKRGPIEITGDAFKALAKNWIILIPGISVFLSLFGGIFLVDYLSTIVDNFSLLIILWVILVIAMIFAVLYFGLGALGLAKEIAEKRKAKWKHVNQYWKKFWVRYLGVTLIIILVFISIAAVVYLLSLLIRILGGEIAFIAALLILGVIGALIGLLFMLPPYMLLINNKSIIDAIKQSVKVSKKNYLSLLGVIVIFFVLSLALSFVPYLGNLFSVIIGATEGIALMMFALERK